MYNVGWHWQLACQCAFSIGCTAPADKRFDRLTVLSPPEADRRTAGGTQRIFTDNIKCYEVLMV